MNVGFRIDALDSVAALPAGLAVKLHAGVVGSLSASVHVPPNCTCAPTVTVWFEPALATGGLFGGAGVTVSETVTTLLSLVASRA